MIKKEKKSQQTTIHSILKQKFSTETTYNFRIQFFNYFNAWGGYIKGDGGEIDPTDVLICGYDMHSIIMSKNTNDITFDFILAPNSNTNTEIMVSDLNMTIDNIKLTFSDFKRHDADNSLICNSFLTESQYKELFVYNSDWKNVVINNVSMIGGE